MKFLVTGKAGTKDLTQLVQRATWSGDKASCARTLEADIACIAGDALLPQADIELGDRVLFYGDAQLFDGFVFSVQVGTSDRTKTIKAFDRGVYLNRNQGYYAFQRTTPEDIVRRVAEDFGIPLGEIARTGYRFSRNFLGQSLYKIIATAYTLASADTGEKYRVEFSLDRLSVRRIEQDDNTLIIRGGSNLLTASVTESIEEMTNRVRVVNKSYRAVDTVEDADAIARYGVMQSVLNQGEDSAKQAKAVLADGGAKQKVTLTCMGDTRSITGRAVAVYESHTGLWGLYWIESDSHTWQNGIYTNKLVVSYKKTMDEQEAGSLMAAQKKSASSKTAKSTEKEYWEYKKG